MKNFILFFLCFYSLPPIFAAGKVRLIILPFHGGNPSEAASLQGLFVRRLQDSPVFEVQTSDAPAVAEAIRALRPSDGPESIYTLGRKTGASYVLAASLDTSKTLRTLRFTVYSIARHSQSPAAEISYPAGGDVEPSIDHDIRLLEEAHAKGTSLSFTDSRILPASPQDIPAPSETLEKLLFRFQQEGLLSDQALSFYRRRGVNARIFSNGFTLMHFAAKEGHLDLLQALVEAGASLAVPDKMDWTPLHHAAYADRADIVRYLIAQNVSLELRTVSNETPLHLAVDNNAVSVARILILQGANTEARDSEGQTPVYGAAQAPSLQILLLLLDSGVSLETRDNRGRTPLFVLTENPWKEHTEAVQMLLQKGASPNAADVFGVSPLKAAMENKYQNISRLLYRYGAQY